MAIERGEVYFVNLNPVKGREQAGTRPVVVLSVDAINRLPLVVTVVVGTKGSNVPTDFHTNVRLTAAETGLSIETVFLRFQLRSLDATRFFALAAGKLTEKALERIEDAARFCLGL